MLLTFSGLDGSGKTTLIAGLHAALEQAGRPVRVLTMYDHVGVYACLRGVRDLLRPAGARSGPETSGPGVSAARTPFILRVLRGRAMKRAVYVVDLALFGLYRFYQEGLRGRVLILDRYFYDSIVDLAEGSPGVQVQSFARWVPTPDVPIYVDAAPEVAFARKGEYSVERLHHRAAIYRQLFDGLRGALIVRNQEAPSSDAVDLIRARVFEGLSA